MSALKIISYLAGGILVLFGLTFICGAFGENGHKSWILVGLIGLLIGVGLIWHARKRTPGEDADNPVSIPAGIPSGWEEEPGKSRRKMMLSIFLGIFLFCGIITVAGFLLAKPKTMAVSYQNASILPMLDLCEWVSYSGIQPWMKPDYGAGEVLELSWTGSDFAYTFYAQIDPGMIKTGTTLNLPSEDVTAFLIDTVPPNTYCSADLEGRIQILEVSKESLRARLEVKSIIHTLQWEFSDEMEFKRVPLPK